jgi:SAM-dependent methyltransferase
MPQIMNLVKRFLKKIYFIPATTLNSAARRNLKQLNRWMLKYPQPRLLNLGCGDRFIGRDQLSLKCRQGLVSFDLLPSSAADAAGDAHDIPFRDESFNAVITQALLEHTRFPFKVADEIFRILKPGGIVYAEVPFIQGYHPTPRDYYRFTPEGLREVFSSFAIMDQGVCGGPGSALGWIFRETVSGMITGYNDRKNLHILAQFVSGWLAFPFKYLDTVYAGRPGACKIASGLYILGEKK